MSLTKRKTRLATTPFTSLATALALIFTQATTVLAQEEAASESGGGGTALIIWLLAFVGSLTALYFAFTFFKSMMAADEGNARMVEIAGYVREGANAYLRQQYLVVSGFFVLIVN